jgi:putative addiction module component (TIGR02574 family)
MNGRVDVLLNEAMELEPEDRAELAERLLSSLEPEDADVADAWRFEIRKRIAELDSGAVQPVSAAEARRRIFRLRDASSDI